MTKKIVSFILITCLIVSSVIGLTVSADTRPDTEIAVSLNGAFMQFTDVQPTLMNDRTMVPFRTIFEALGCEVSWDEQAQTAIGERNEDIIKLPLDNQLAKVNGYAVYLDQPAVIQNDRTLVPLRFVAETLGAKVEWDQATQTVYITADVQEQSDNYLFTGASFTDTGTWGFESSTGGAFPDGALRGGTNETPENTVPAVLTFNAANAGEYYVWVRSRDYPNDRPGIRTFNVEVNGTDIGEFGNHGKEGYAWVQGNNVNLIAGSNEVKLVDTADFYGRCDGIFITNNPELVPSEDYNELLEVVTPYEAGSDVSRDATFPSYATELAEPEKVDVLENENIKVTFYTVPTAQGTVIQNEIAVKQNDGWVTTKYRQEDFGYLIVAADTAKETQPIGEALSFNTTFLVGSKYASYYGTNIYNAGMTYWAIPTSIQTDGKQAVLTASTDVADLEVTWVLEENAPLVTVRATYKNAGAYSIGVMEGREIPYNQIENVYVADVITDKQTIRPDPGILMGKDTVGHASVFYTLSAQNIYTPGSKIIKGLQADISGSWAIGMRGPDCNYRAALFAPVLGESDSAVAAGGTQTVTYRVLSSVAE